MEQGSTKPRRRRRTAPWWPLVAGIGLTTLGVIVLLAPAGRTASARMSFPGAGDASDAELTAVVRARGSLAAVAAATDVPARRLASALEARRGAARQVVVEYRADRSPSELRRVTVIAARRLADSIAASEVGAAEARAQRAAAGITDHEASTGIGDPEGALAGSEQRLAELQARRDQAVATRSESASSLEEEVAVAQQKMFDLQAVATRRVALIDAQRRAAAGVDAARAARRLAGERVASSTAARPRVTVDAGTSDPSAWQVVLAGVLLALGAAAAVAGVVGVLRKRRARPRAPQTADVSPSERPALDGVRGDGPEVKPRIELDEIERRLAALNAVEPPDTSSRERSG